MTLSDTIKTQIAPYKDYVSICLYDEDQLVYSHRADQQQPAASLIKLAILATQLDVSTNLNEPISLASTPTVGGAGVVQLLHTNTLPVSDVLALMIAVSDNYAANLMIQHLSMARINDWLTTHGFTQTILQRQLMDSECAAKGLDNFTTAQEAIDLLRYLLNTYPQVRPWFLKQQFRSKLPVTFDELPTDILVYNKTGEGPKVDHDVARFERSKHHIDLAVMTSGIDNRLEVMQLFGQLGQTIANSL